MATYAGADLTNFQNNLDALYHTGTEKHKFLTGVVYNNKDATPSGDVISPASYYDLPQSDPGDGSPFRDEYVQVRFDVDHSQANAAARLISHDHD